MPAHFVESTDTLPAATVRMKPWLLDMWWHDVCFIHWRADALALAQGLPQGVEIDRFDGDAWLSVVPFRMVNVRPRGGPVLPGFGSVPEINLRTYVRFNGRAGVWFYSLDASSPIAVRAARLATALPYYDAHIATYEDNGIIDYSSDRHERQLPGGGFHASYKPSGDACPAQPGSLDAFLHERYRFVTHRGSRLLAAELRHEPWLLQQATIEIKLNTLGALVNDRLERPPERVTFARRLHVRATATTLLRRPT